MSESRTVDDIFTLLKLNNEEGKLLQNTMLSTWVSYVNLQGKNPYDMILVKLSTHYDEAGLAKMLVTAKQDGQTSSIVRKLEEMQFKNWQSDGKSADDVFKLLQLKKEGNKLFDNPVWRIWIAYLTKLDKENADELMFVVLKQHFGDEGVARMVTVANKGASTKDIGRKLQEELWRSQGKDGDDVFKLLKLDKEEKQFFESPALSTWISYVTKFDKQNPDAISQLERRFGGDIELARMIGFAKLKATRAATEKVITQLQNLQFKQWLAAGMTPNRISAKMLLGQFDTRNTKVILDYYDFVRRYG